MIRTFTFLLTVFYFTLAGAQQYIVPKSLKATGYDAHVEINYENTAGFCYIVYLSTDNGLHFQKRAENNTGFFLDFPGKSIKNQKLIYRVIPKGMSVTGKDAAKFECSVSTHAFSDEQLIDMVQRYTTRYFFDFAHPDCGMARERSNDIHGDIVTTGGTGFGIMALVAGAQRNYFSREQAFSKIEQIVSFLEKVDRYHGAWAHWYNGNTGKVYNFSQYDDGGDLVETAFLTQGLLTARQYFTGGTDKEKALSSRITQLWEDIDWNWYTDGTDSLYWHWSKNYGFRMRHRIKGFDETMITYVLAASSPTHPIRPEVFNCWRTSDYYFNGKSYFGIPLSLGMNYGGPLFFTHYSYLGLNPSGLSNKDADIWERNRAHVLIHRAYAISNPKNYKGYGANCWGFTSSDDPLVGYTSHHPGTPDENGTISPTAALSSLPYAPQEVLPVFRHFYYDLGAVLLGRYGFYDAFNLNLVQGQQVVHSYLAIDQGPIAVMIENYRSGLIWKLFMQNDEINNGLKRMGFQYKNQ
ncbi:MAG: glucoamylase family protein [Bacteroidota bacterium]|nr:glucoamylase family protein [Bacteroidota bacterium]